MLVLPWLPMMTACGEDQEAVSEEVAPQAGDETESTNDGDMKTDTLKLKVGERSFTATLAANSSAAALVERLKKGPVTVNIDDYADMEKVGPLGFSLPRNDRQTTTSPGDIILYQGDNFVIYYDTNSWNFTRLGRVNGISSREHMLQLLGGKGRTTITLSL